MYQILPPVFQVSGRISPLCDTVSHSLGRIRIALPRAVTLSLNRHSILLDDWRQICQQVSLIEVCGKYSHLLSRRATDRSNIGRTTNIRIVYGHLQTGTPSWLLEKPHKNRGCHSPNSSFRIRWSIECPGLLNKSFCQKSFRLLGSMATNRWTIGWQVKTVKG